MRTVLSRTDQRVNELVGGVGEPQNLVSSHLGVLKRAHVASERRSSADGRDIYHHLDLERLGYELGGAAATLHPTLRPNAPSAGAEHDSDRRAPRVLFLCTGNSARSLIAEGIVQERWPGVLRAFRAGPRPAGLPDPAAVTGSQNKQRAAFRSNASELIERIGQLAHQGGRPRNHR